MSRTPDATALVSDDLRLTYAELDRATDLAADRLAAAGVGPGALTGLLVERDGATVVWLLAILKRGAAYVPLDPDYPPERTRFVVEDARLSFVVGERSTAERLELADDRLVDRAPSPLPAVAGDGDGDRKPMPAPSVGSTAYVIYTSGSTGKPKGCVITHGNVHAFLEGALPRFDLTADDRWALVTSLCFDVSVWELGRAGHRRHRGRRPVADARVARSTRRLPAGATDHRSRPVPSVFRYTASAHAQLGHPQLALRHFLLAGESVNLDVVRDFVDGTGGAGASPPTVVNGYGPTEATVLATFKVLDAETLGAGVPSPIGQPFPHVAAHVLDDDRAPVPDGTPGELWLSGPSLSSGYLRRDDLTQERFVDLPLGPSGTIRCYRTGDVVRRLPGGDLEYLGRDDDQVKIRGFRIELHEIETVLGSHPDALDAAVCVVDAAAGPALAACVVCVDSFADDLTESMRKVAKALLPAHMVPRWFVAVDRLPLTPSGKLDRVAVAECFSHLAQA